MHVVFHLPHKNKTVYIHMYIRKTNLFNIKTFILPYLSITMIDPFLIQIHVTSRKYLYTCTYIVQIKYVENRTWN